ncbi:MAG: Glycosyl hydrolase family 20, catalytic domain [Lentisphaerae bacterium ADurb.Bin242]|nr:MAG: Glycosyl hydrolase family 20, catalytic domain [Lentisphaerae bacterium ADurb.Bin242]
MASLAASMVFSALPAKEIPWKQDFPVIIPEVQKLAAGAGSFTVPEKLTVSAPAGFDLTGLEKTLKEHSPEILLEKSEKGLLQFILTERDVPENVEGYTLTVARTGVTVAARHRRGLFYGMQSLRWIVRNSPGNQWKAVRIEDWPDLALRGAYVELRGHGPESIGRYRKVIDMLGMYKYNTLMLEISDGFPFEGNPLSNRKAAFSKQDMMALLETARANQMEIIPFLQAVSHVYWMRAHPKFETDISEGPARTPWNSAYCLSKPLPLELMKKCIRETAEFFQPKYYCIGLDEISYCPFQVCDECRKHDPAELVAGHVGKLEELIRRLGAIPIVAHDQFLENSHVNSRIIKMLDTLDRRNVILVWEYAPYPPAASTLSFTKRGFPVLHMSWTRRLLNTAALPRQAKELGSLGCILSQWWDVDPAFDPEKARRGSPHGYAGSAIGGDYSWKPHPGSIYTSLPYDPVYETRRLLDPRDLPDFSGRKAAEVPLGGVINHAAGGGEEFPDFTPEALAVLQKELASGPEKFRLITSKDRYFGVVLSGSKEDGYASKPVTVPVHCKLAGLSFLMAASTLNELEYNQKPVLGSLKINYLDGKSRTVDLVYRYNLCNWNAGTGGYDARLVNRGIDRHGYLYGFHALDWVNPRPDVLVKEVVFSTTRTSGIAPALFAVSAIDPEGALPAPPDDKAAIRAVPASRKTVEADRKVITCVADFESGAVPADFRIGCLPGRNAGMLKSSIALTPDAPTPGKSLRIDVPPLLKNANTGRVTIDVPLPENKNIRTLLFDYRLSHPEYIQRFDVYLLNPGGGAEALLDFTESGSDNQWRHVNLPVRRLRIRENGGVDPKKPLYLRLGFFVTNMEPMSISLDRIGIADVELPEGCRNKDEMDKSNISPSLNRKDF